MNELLYHTGKYKLSIAKFPVPLYGPVMHLANQMALSYTQL